MACLVKSRILLAKHDYTWFMQSQLDKTSSNMLVEPWSPEFWPVKTMFSVAKTTIFHGSTHHFECVRPPFRWVGTLKSPNWPYSRPKSTAVLLRSSVAVIWILGSSGISHVTSRCIMSHITWVYIYIYTYYMNLYVSYVYHVFQIQCNIMMCIYPFFMDLMEYMFT